MNRLKATIIDDLCGIPVSAYESFFKKLKTNTVSFHEFSLQVFSSVYYSSFIGKNLINGFFVTYNNSVEGFVLT